MSNQKFKKRFVIDDKTMIVDKETGELSPRRKVVYTDRETFYQLYASTFGSLLDKTPISVDMKVFAACLICSTDSEIYGNLVENGPTFKELLARTTNLSPSSLCRSFKHLCQWDFLTKIDSNRYQINPSLAFKGDTASRHEFIVAYDKNKFASNGRQEEEN